MNTKRRKKVQQVITYIENMTELIQEILDEELEAYENMPEGLQASDRGISSEEAQANLELAIETLEEAASCLEEVC